MKTLPRIALVGCGAWGQNLARVCASRGTLARVVDTSEAGRAQAARVVPGTPVSTHIEDACGDDIDAVVISTPAETHHAVGQRALDAGKDVFVEKPITLRHAEAMALVTKAEKVGRILMVGHVLEYHPAIEALHRMLQGGELGELRYVYSNRLNLGKIRREENALWSFAPHDIAVILRLFGGLPQKVVSCGAAYVQPNIADVTMTHLHFGDSAQGHIFVSWLHPFKEQRLVVVGSRNMVSFDDVNKRLMLYDRRVELQGSQPVPVSGAGRTIEFAPDEPLGREMDAFVHAIQTRQPPLTDGRSGARTLRVLEAAQASLQNAGMPVLLSE